jgi:hypothetical protein
MSDESRTPQVVGGVIGAVLIGVGLSFFALLIRLKIGGELTGDVKISLFLAGMGVLLLWVGRTSFHRPRSSPKAASGIATRLRLPAEIATAVGCLIALCHSIEMASEAPRLPEVLVRTAIAIPVVVGLLLPVILLRPTLWKDPFADFMREHWSKAHRTGISVLLHVGRLGYLAIIWLVWGHSIAFPSSDLHRAFEVVAFMMVSVLCASQVFLLHFVKQDVRRRKAMVDRGAIV